MLWNISPEEIKGIKSTRLFTKTSKELYCVFMGASRHR